MSTEKQHDAVSLLLGVGLERGADVVGKGLDEAGVGGPAVDYGPFDLLLLVHLSREHEQLVEG